MRTLCTVVSAALVATLVACGSSSGEVIYGADGGVLGDTGVQPINHMVGPSQDSGSATIDVFIPPTPTGDSGVIPTADTGVPTGDSAAPPPATDGGACPPATCTTDSECSCLAASGAIGCCDTVTSACFSSAASVCPDQMSTGTGDSGGTGGY